MAQLEQFSCSDLEVEGTCASLRVVPPLWRKAVLIYAMESALAAAGGTNYTGKIDVLMNAAPCQLTDDAIGSVELGIWLNAAGLLNTDISALMDASKCLRVLDEHQMDLVLLFLLCAYIAQVNQVV